MIFSKDHILYYIIGAILLCSCLTKLSIITHFPSENDDHTVVSAIVKAKRPLDLAAIRFAIHDTSKSTYNSHSKQLARWLDKKNLLAPVMKGIHFLAPFYAVPNENTYAPLQFVFTAMLVREGQTLKESFFYGRLPSLICCLLTALVFFFLAMRFFSGRENKLGIIYAVLILSFSYEFIIYAVQMESYAIGLLGLLVLTWRHLGFLADKAYQDKRKTIGFGILCGLLVWMQYQLLFFVAASWLAIAYELYKAKRIDRKILFNAGFLVIAFLVFFIPVYFLFLTKYTSHVANVLVDGKKAVFFFPAYAYKSIWDHVIYTIHFFTVNPLIVFRYMTLGFTIGSPLEYAMLIVNLFLFVMGLFSLYRSKKESEHSYLVFFNCALLVWIVLLLKGGIALTPDRHSLILLPLFAINIFFGVRLLAARLKEPVTMILTFALPAIFIIGFLFTWQTFFKYQQEPYMSDDFKAVFTRNNIDLIIANDEQFFLNSEWYTRPVFFQNKDLSRQGWIYRPAKASPPQTIAFMGLGPFQPEWNGRLPKEIADYYQQDSINLRKSYRMTDAFYASSKTDEIHPDFVRRIDLRCTIFKKK